MLSKLFLRIMFISRLWC